MAKKMAAVADVDLVSWPPAVRPLHAYLSRLYLNCEHMFGGQLFLSYMLFMAHRPHANAVQGAREASMQCDLMREASRSRQQRFQRMKVGFFSQSHRSRKLSEQSRAIELPASSASGA